MNHVKDGKKQSNENVGNDVEMENNAKIGGSSLKEFLPKKTSATHNSKIFGCVVASC